MLSPKKTRVIFLPWTNPDVVDPTMTRVYLEG